MHYSNIPPFQYFSLCYVGARRSSATKQMGFFRQPDSVIGTLWKDNTRAKSCSQHRLSYKRNSVHLTFALSTCDLRSSLLRVTSQARSILISLVSV